MTQQLSPWVEGAYGWNFGEGGWNSGMDQNLLKFSFLFDRNVDSITASLPAAVNGEAHYLTTDNRLYFAVGTTYFSTPVPKWFSVFVRGTGQAHQFNGTSLVQTDTPAQLDTRLDAVELTVSSLGTAAFEDITFFATQAELDVAEADSAAYTDTLRADVASTISPSNGAGMVGFDLGLAYPDNSVGREVQLAHTLTSVYRFLTQSEIADSQSFVGSIDITAKVQSAIDTGAALFFPPGAYLASPLYLPNNAVLNGVVGPDGTVRGNCLIGTNQTVLKQVDSTKPVLSKSETNGRLYNWTIGPFVFMPASGGSTAPALDLSGMTFCTINQPRGVSNGSDGFYSLIRLNSSPVPGLPGGQTRQCHGNTINDPTLEGADGYTKGIDFDDGGLGADYGAHANTIVNPKVFNCGTSLTHAIDAAKAYGIVIYNPVLELCPNALGIVMGDGTQVYGGAIETMAAPFDYSQPQASRSYVTGTAITNNGTNQIQFGAEARSNTWHMVNDKTGHTWVGGAGKGNKKGVAVRFSAGAIPTGIVISRVSGATGTVSAVSGVILEPWSADGGYVAYRSIYTFAATSSGVARMNIGAPANPSFGTFNRVSQEVGIYDAASVSYPSAPASASDFIFTATSGITYTMTVVVRFKLVHSDAAT